MKNGSTSAGFIKFYENTTDGTSNTQLIGAAIAGNIVITLPNATSTLVGTGAENQFSADQIFDKKVRYTPNIIDTISTTTPTEENRTALTLNDVVTYLDLDQNNPMYAKISTGTDGQIVHIFFDNHQPGTLEIEFFNCTLMSGSGSNSKLTFSQTGQSASLIYISSLTKWCIINTGAAIS